MRRRLSALLFLALHSACASVSAQTAQTAQSSRAVPSFAAQPENIRNEVLLGEPRASQHIPDSPFGIQTTICAEGGPADYMNKAAGAIAAAGYKWVGEYVLNSWKGGQAPQLSDAATWSKLPTRCGEHLARLQASGISILMRVDPLPTRMLRGSEPVTETELALATAYTRNVVTQLKPYTKHWQIGNEV